jgi:hypothetical protein
VQISTAGAPQQSSILTSFVSENFAPIIVHSHVPCNIQSPKKWGQKKSNLPADWLQESVTFNARSGSHDSFMWFEVPSNQKAKKLCPHVVLILIPLPQATLAACRLDF